MNVIAPLMYHHNTGLAWCKTGRWKFCLFGRSGGNLARLDASERSSRCPVVVQIGREMEDLEGEVS